MYNKLKIVVTIQLLFLKSIAMALIGRAMFHRLNQQNSQVIVWQRLRFWYAYKTIQAQVKRCGYYGSIMPPKVIVQRSTFLKFPNIFHIVFGYCWNLVVYKNKTMILKIKNAADPYLKDEGGFTLMLYERILGRRGKIAWLTLDQSFKIIASGDMDGLEDGHKSYPQVFKLGEQEYFTCESCECGKTRIYQYFFCHNKKAPLIGDLVCEIPFGVCDPFISKIDDNTFIMVGTCRYTEHEDYLYPIALRITVNGDKFQIEQLKNYEFDLLDLNVRGGGHFGSDKVRIIQRQGISRYGCGIEVSRVEVNSERMREIQREKVTSEIGREVSEHSDVHHYSQTPNGIYAFDFKTLGR